MTILHTSQRNRQKPDIVRTEVRSLSGWGGAPRSTAEVVSPRLLEQLAGSALGANGYIARGLGRSYGDAGLVAGGTVVDMTGLTDIDVDPARGRVTAMAGASLGKILELVLPDGWFLPVSPGTRHVTVGGAIASDVHGKNHHRDGSFGHHVEFLELLTGDGRLLTVTPASEAFAATVGGMGLTGIIARATFRMLRVETGWMSVDTNRSTDLESVMSDLVEADSRHQYSVAWLDLSHPGSGRGIVMGGDHATQGQVPASVGEPRNRTGVSVPRWMPRVVDKRTVPLFNRLWWQRAPKRESARLTSIDSFFFPLDALGDWNRLYGRRGFLQYQFVVPQGEENTLEAIAEKLASASTPVSLAVLKRLGPAKSELLSFPMHGWTLAVDMPLGNPDLATTLDECDVLVARSGGRVYLSKDSRLRPDALEEMYPQLARWRRIRGDLDPDRRLRSNLSDRLRLIANKRI